MPLTFDPDAALAQLRATACELPEVEERASHGQPTFFVVGKQFAQFRHDHHGDGRTIVAVKVDPEEGRNLIAIAPERYGPVAYLGEGWIGLSLAENADWDQIGDRVARSWELAAPARLLEAGGR
jgi:hypothetical protein